MDGCSVSRSSGSGTGRDSTVTVSLLVSNPYYVCWVSGGAHNAAGGLALTTLALVVVAFPISFIWAVYYQHCASTKATEAEGRSRDDGRATVPATMIYVNPLRGGAEPEISAVSDVLVLPRILPPLLAPYMSDYRSGAWYTRHVDLTLSLLLAALQVCWEIDVSFKW